MRQQPPIGATLDFFNDFVTENADALLLHRRMQAAAHVLIKPRQDLLAAVDQRRINAEAVKNIGEFHRDVTAAGDQNGFWQCFKIKRFV